MNTSIQPNITTIVALDQSSIAKKINDYKSFNISIPKPSTRLGNAKTCEDLYVIRSSFRGRFEIILTFLLRLRLFIN